MSLSPTGNGETNMEVTIILGTLLFGALVAIAFLLVELSFQKSIRRIDNMYVEKYISAVLFYRKLKKYQKYLKSEMSASKHAIYNPYYIHLCRSLKKNNKRIHAVRRIIKNYHFDYSRKI